ncbi:hypothetical protein [Streptosporangium sp. NPDC049078]|uniref:hypothetical protein n=1 Tax=Streptosporangium sp. NPDC049078 TaxID=3155767 RepID=UPI0034437568
MHASQRGGGQGLALAISQREHTKPPSASWPSTCAARIRLPTLGRERQLQGQPGGDRLDRVADLLGGDPLPRTDQRVPDAGGGEKSMEQQREAGG